MQTKHENWHNRVSYAKYEIVGGLHASELETAASEWATNLLFPDRAEDDNNAGSFIPFSDYSEDGQIPITLGTITCIESIDIHPTKEKLIYQAAKNASERRSRRLSHIRSTLSKLSVELPVILTKGPKTIRGNFIVSRGALPLFDFVRPGDDQERSYIKNNLLRQPNGPIFLRTPILDSLYFQTLPQEPPSIRLEAPSELFGINIREVRKPPSAQIS